MCYMNFPGRFAGVLFGLRSQGNDEVLCGNSASIAQTMLLIRSDEGSATGPQARSLAGDGDLDSPGDNEEHFFAHMVVRGMRSPVRLKYSLVYFKVVAGVGVPFEDATERGWPLRCRMEVVEGANGCGEGVTAPRANASEKGQQQASVSAGDRHEDLLCVVKDSRFCVGRHSSISNPKKQFTAEYAESAEKFRC